MSGPGRPDGVGRAVAKLHAYGQENKALGREAILPFRAGFHPPARTPQQHLEGRWGAHGQMLQEKKKLEKWDDEIGNEPPLRSIPVVISGVSLRDVG